MKKTPALILCLVMLQLFCGQWRSTTLNPRKIAFIKNGPGPGQILIKSDEESGYDESTVSVGVFNNRVVTADNVMRRIQVMEPVSDGAVRNRNIDLVLGDVKDIAKKSDYRTASFNFGTIGTFTMDNDRNLYIQNRITGKASPKKQEEETMDFTPSFILVFNDRGELQYTLGQKGAPDVPFFQIESMFIDSKGRLFVISRTIESWSVSRFSGKTRDFHVNLGKIDFSEKEDGVTYRGRIDNVRALHGGERLFISISFYHDTRLKYIKVFDYSMEKQKIEKTVMTIPDPKNVLFDVTEDRYLYFWNVTSDQVKFIVATLDGSIVNNLALTLKYRRNQYAKIFLDNGGRIHSFHVNSRGIEINKWE